MTGILARQFTSTFKNFANVFRPMGVSLHPKYSSTKPRVYNEKDLEKIQENYFRANKDIYDKLNMAEFNEFISLTVGRQMDGLDIRELFTILDDNKDEYISMREIKEHLNKGLTDPKDGDVMYAFCRFDKDFDDYIYLHEAREALFYLGFFQAGARIIEEFFYKRDTNDDKRLNYEEFAAIVKKDMPTLF